jgi:hypothetical protein
MPDKIPVHTDGRLRHRATSGDLQPALPGAGPDLATGCDLPPRQYPYTEDRCPDCGGHMQHIQHVIALRASKEIHFDHHCLATCKVRFRDA